MKYLRSLACWSLLTGALAWPALAGDGQSYDLAAVDREESDANRSETWLGVQLSPVPAALASHLQLGDAGVMIRNVFVDSPADRAGLERYDVITEADGKPVTGGVAAVESFSRHVRDAAPGSELKLTLHRKGQKKEAALKLERMPAKWQDLELKYQNDPDVAYEREFGLQGKILRPGPDGWRMEDLGNMPGWREYTEALRKWRDGMKDSNKGLREWRNRYGPNQPRPPESQEIDEARRVDKEGRVLHAQRLEGGTIEVRRYHQGQGQDQAEVKVYKNMEALRDGDPEAYELLRPGPAAHRGPEPPTWAPDRPPPWEGLFQQQKPGAPPSGTTEQWEEWMEKFFQGPMKHLKDYVKTLPESIAAKEDTRFEVGADGQVTVHLRDQDKGTALSRTYQSRAQFKEQAPELYQQFEAIEKKLR